MGNLTCKIDYIYYKQGAKSYNHFSKFNLEKKKISQPKKVSLKM